MKVEALRTPAPPEAVGRAMALAWLRLLGAMPERVSVNLLLAQWAHESARGKSCFCWNLGNAKSTPAWDGDFCERYCNEVLSEKQAADALSRAGLREDGSPDVVLGGIIGGARVVNFYPPNPASRFRAFATLEDGALDYVSLLYDRFSSAWRHVVSGDGNAFAKALRAARYYTAPEATYAAGLRSLAREYSHLAIDLSPPPTDPTGALAAVQSASLATLSADMIAASFRRTDE